MLALAYINEKRKYPRLNLGLPLEYGETHSQYARGALVANAWVRYEATKGVI
jgi:hypothetical protein